MTGITAIDHVQITVPSALEAEVKHFYGTVLGLGEIPKPPPLAKNGGAWYRVGGTELHVSLEDDPAAANADSRRHVCYLVADLPAMEATLRERGAEIITDKQPIAGWVRFYLRDPGGNRIEIAQRIG